LISKHSQPSVFNTVLQMLPEKAFAGRGRLQGLPIQGALAALCPPRVKQFSTVCIVLLTIDGTAARSLFCRRGTSRPNKLWHHKLFICACSHQSEQRMYLRVPARAKSAWLLVKYMHKCIAHKNCVTCAFCSLTIPRPRRRQSTPPTRPDLLQGLMERGSLEFRP
jgi:hypothetical protein